jgi:hypothetical protein
MFQEARMRPAILIFVSFLLVFLPAPALAKGQTVKITIEGGSLRAPIVITDAQTLAPFNIWSGPGTFGCESPKTLPCAPDSARDVKSYPPSFVVDWSRGVIAAPSRALPRYKVSFWASNDPQKLAYVVTYAFDPATKQGYIYLPGGNDDGYYINTGSLSRSVVDPDVEGNWFRAWIAWDKVATPLIDSGIIKN